MPGVAASTTLQYTGIAVFVAIVLYVVLYYSRSFHSVFLTRRHDANLATVTGGDPGPVQALGLGPDDVAVLPTFTYHAAASPDIVRGVANAKATTAAAADCCAVCLEDLRDGALVPMLASCKHYFHVECVDVWLLSPPLPQLRRCGAPSLPEERGGTSSGEKDMVSSSSPSPVMRSPMRFEVSTGNGDAAMSPLSPTHQPRTPPEGRVCRTRSPSPVATGSNGVQV